MKTDVSTEFFRPRGVVEKAESATEFFRAAEIHGAEKITAKVKNEPDILEYGTGKQMIGRTYFNLFTAFDESGKTLVIYREDYDEGRISTKDLEEEDSKKKEDLEWACMLTARNRLRLAGEDTKLAIISRFAEYTRLNFSYVDIVAKEENIQYLTVKRKP